MWTEAGVKWVTVHCVSLAAALAAPPVVAQEFLHHVPLFGTVAEPAESMGGEIARNQRQGFVRVINNSSEGGEVSILAIDDAGTESGPVTLTLSAREARQFSTDDLRDGNATDKGLNGSIGDPIEGDWRLELTTELDVDVLAYIRTSEGFLTSIHDAAPTRNGTHEVAIFNPGRNTDQVSKLRIVNLDAEWTEVSVTGIDDDGNLGNSPVRVPVPPRGAATISAVELERRGLGALERGKWRLEVVEIGRGSCAAICGTRPVKVMSLLYGPTGHITNLSTMPANSTTADGVTVHDVPFFQEHVESAPAAVTRQGFLRLINLGDEEATVNIAASDDDPGTHHEQIGVRIPARSTVHINSMDVENGNEAKGFPVGVGDGNGTWRLQLTTSEHIRVLSYVRTSDGFLTSLHDMAPAAGDYHEVSILNPGRNTNQKSSLRLINDGESAASVTITATDDRGVLGDDPVEVSVPARATKTVSARDLESGRGVDGALGSHAEGGKWRLRVEASRPIGVMNLLDTPTGHLTNLSTVPPGGDEFPDSWLIDLYEDSVLVMHVPDDLTSVCDLPLKTYAEHVYRWFEDAFDVLIFTANLEFDENKCLNFSGRFHHVQNDVRGIGLDLFSVAGEYGSAGRLRGVIEFPFEYSLGWGPLMHELMHMWANYAVPSSDRGHFYFSWGVEASGHIGGFDVEDVVALGNGRYAVDLQNSDRYSALEMYFAGLVPPEVVPDRKMTMDGKWLRGGDGQIVRDENGWRVFTTHDVRDYSISDTTARHGPRTPDWKTARRDFRAAIIVLVDDDHPISLRRLRRNAALVRNISSSEFSADDFWHYQNYQFATERRGTLTTGGLGELRKRSPGLGAVPESFGNAPPASSCVVTEDGRVEHR